MRRIMIFISGLILCLGIMQCKSSKETAPKDSQNLAAEIGKGTWQLLKLNNKVVNADDYMKGLPFIRFDGSESISGSTGCNNFQARYEGDNGSMMIIPGAMSKMMCPGTGERDFLTAISKVSRAKVENENLVMSDSEGSRLLEFKPMDEK